ncbi:MAG: N-acetyl-gamma-glutamyl-phosphate reductase [Chloroflexi bacterium]|nr:N-acetyl-gamma-glutamyl-phosphate reductase [Chloroflexota bacterium]
MPRSLYQGLSCCILNHIGFRGGAWLKVGIVNVTGYAGLELARLLLKHPAVELTQVTGRSAVGQPLADMFPHLGETDLVIQAEIDGSVDVAFSALPHKASAAAARPLLEAGAKVIDISADFRLKDVGLYEKWYQVAHPAPELLAEAVYGLPELHRDEIRNARLIANPGCYPTSAILALSPVAGLIEPDVIVDSKSGVSGGGRTLSLTNHYSEVNENCQAYALGGHRHLPEMVQELSYMREKSGAQSADDLSMVFLPHLVPMTRGILSSCYARLTVDLSTQQLRERYRELYETAPFVRVVDKPPQTKHTWGSNYCVICPTIDTRTKRLIVISCIDNLVKGAAGQAVQNMNLMLGLDETLGIEQTPIYP